MIVQLQNDIARLQAGPGCCAFRLNPDHQGTPRFVQAKRLGQFLRDFLNVDPKLTAVDLAVELDLFSYIHGQINRNGKRNTHESAGAAVYLRIDANNFTLQVEQWPARVTRVDRDIGLDERHVGIVRQAATLGRHDASRDRVFKAEGGANGGDPLTWFELVRVTNFYHGQAAGIDLEQGDIRAFVQADQFGLEFPFVGQYDLDWIAIHDNMGIRHDVAVAADDEA